ncbi:MAG: ATP-binding protein [Oleibacter sp.]|nr:ATP-binding protein [Thalassolituus sp.]
MSLQSVRLGSLVTISVVLIVVVLANFLPLSALADVAAIAKGQNLLDLLKAEILQIKDVLTGVAEAWLGLLQRDITERQRYDLVMQSGLPLLLFIPLRWAAKWFAAVFSRTLVTTHNQVISKGVKHQGVRALARLVLGLAPLLPWFVLLIASSMFFDEQSEPNLGGSLLVMFQVYMLYVLVNLASEWFLLSICQGAGSYLSADSTKKLEQRTEIAAKWLLLPWATIAIVIHLLGKSLIVNFIETVVWLFSWGVVSYLLHFYRNELMLNLKRLVPASVDPFLDKVKNSWAFLLILPVLVPLLLLMFMRVFLTQLLADFAWYQSLSARWFRIKTKTTGDSEEDEISVDSASEDYQRWFSTDTASELKLPIIDTGLSAAIRKDFNAWNAERSEDNVILITGERGIGKSSAVIRFTNSLAQDDPDIAIKCIDIPPKTTSQDAIYQLLGRVLDIDMSEGPKSLVRHDAEMAPTVVILNNAENLFLAEVGYLDGWRTLLGLTNTKLNNVYWLITINNQSWAYLCNVFGREYQMRNVVRVKRWTQTEIRSLILSRNQLSGYRLQYDDVLIDTRAPATGAMRNAEQRYFSLLWDGCRGLPMTALELWQGSVRTKGKNVIATIPQLPSSSRFEQFGSKLMFVFAAIVTHENLTTEELVAVTNMQENVIRFALKSALDAEIIARGSDGRYRITTLWYYTVVSSLNRKNMLHE